MISGGVLINLFSRGEKSRRLNAKLLRTLPTNPALRVGERKVVITSNSSWNLVHFRSNIIAALQRAGFVVIAIAPQDAHTPALTALGVEFHALGFRSAGMSPASDIVLFARYVALLRAIRPELVLAFTVKPNIYASLAARLLGVSTINNVSGLGTVFINRGLVTRVVSALYAQAFQRAATVFFQNDDDREQFVSARLVDRGRTRLLPGSGIDLDRFRPVALPVGRRFTFLLVARLLGDKGLQEYFDAATIVKRQYPDVRFQILGFADVDNRTAVPRTTLDRWIAGGIIEYLGAADDVRPFLAGADCVVLPSYREGLPRALLEGSAMARPLVATDVPGVRDVVHDGVTGLLCRARSAEALAHAMLTMYAMSPAARRAMGAAGRARVEREFDVVEVTRRYLAAVDDAVPRA